MCYKTYKYNIESEISLLKMCTFAWIKQKLRLFYNV